MLAGFASVDITPPLGTHKVGWLRDLVPVRIVDSLFARAAVFDDGESVVVMVQVDTLSIRWSTVEEVRAAVELRTGIPGGNVMVGATHNHGGPAVGAIGEVPRDDAYLAVLVEKLVGIICQAYEGREEAELGFGSTPEYGLSHNRRIVHRDGITRTHGMMRAEGALYVEGPIDPEVSVLAARRADGSILGAVFNFTCHPTDLGGDLVFTGGWPAAAVAAVVRSGVGDAVFLQGACGQISSGMRATGYSPNHIEMGEALARVVVKVLDEIEYSASWPLAARRRTVQLPYREATDEQIKGTVRGAQRFIDSAIYDRGMPKLLERIVERGEQPAEVQVLSVGKLRYVSIPAEYFVEYGLAIKEAAHPLHAVVVAYANGMVGYVPTREAFARGGYETTFAGSSRLAPEAGDLLRDLALKLIEESR